MKRTTPLRLSRRRRPGCLQASPRVAGTRGFTLIEVLVALVVVATGLTAALVVLDAGSRRALAVEARTIGTWVALNRLAELRLQPSPRSPGWSEGVEHMAYRDWPWRVRLEATDDAAVLRAVVLVEDQELPPQVVVEFTGYLAR